MQRFLVARFPCCLRGAIISPRPVHGYCHLHLLHLQKCRPQSHAYANCICTCCCSSSSTCSAPVRSRQHSVKLDQCKGKAAHFSLAVHLVLCLRPCVCVCVPACVCVCRNACQKSHRMTNQSACLFVCS